MNPSIKFTNYVASLFSQKLKNVACIFLSPNCLNYDDDNCFCLCLSFCTYKKLSDLLFSYEEDVDDIVVEENAENINPIYVEKYFDGYYSSSSDDVNIINFDKNNVELSDDSSSDDENNNIEIIIDNELPEIISSRSYPIFFKYNDLNQFRIPRNNSII